MRRSLAALALALVLPLPGVAAESYVVKPGETLSEIAERTGVSTARLMQLNGIKDPNLVESGTRLQLPGSRGSGGAPSGQGNYTVKPGETLSEIAESRGISLKRLMELNGIQQADRVEAGSRIVVPGAAVTPAPARAAAVNKTAREHVVQPGETLSGIADRYGIPMSQLMASNAINTPNHLEAGTRLALRSSTAPSPVAKAVARPTTKPVAKPVAQPVTKPVSQPVAKAASEPVARAVAAPAIKPAATPAVTKPVVAARPARGGAPDWRSYGPLQVDFANWQPLGGSQVAPALNGKGQQIFLAVNCTARKLNSTGEAGAWKTWDQPQSEFEERLILDACKAPAS